MTEMGKNILAAVREVRSVFETASLLLSSASDFMSGEGWVPSSSTAAAGGSNSIHYPRFWMPRDVFRFFTRKDRENLICYISVIFDDLDDLSAIEEPLVSAGWLDYGTGSKIKSDWNYNFARMMLHLEEPIDDGSLVEIPHQLISEREGRTVQRARTLALPLVSIEDVPGLESLVVNPLLKDIEEIAV